MKNMEIKKKINRKKAASRRAIQAYWLAKAKEAYADWQREISTFDALSATPLAEFEKYCEEGENVEECKAAFVEDYRMDCIDAEYALRNALCRYQQAIPKGGAC